MEIVQKINVFK